MAKSQSVLAPRIHFGKVVHCAGIEGKCLFRHFIRGEGILGAHDNIIDTRTSLQIKDACLLAEADRGPEDGPFSDRGGAIAALGKIIFGSCGGPDEKLARLAAMINDDRFFRFCPDMVFGDRPFMASDVITDESRAARDALSGECSRLFGDILEPYLFSVSLLRSGGFLAFPAFAILHGPKDEYSPLLAVADPDGPIPLRTISLLTTHPPMHHLALLGDRSASGLSYAMLAQTRMKALCGLIMEDIGNKRAPSDEMLFRMSDSISDSLLSSHMIWPGNPFIGDSLDRMGNMIFQRLSSIALGAGFEGPELRDMLQSAAAFSAGVIGRIEDSFHAKKRMSSDRMRN